MKEAGYAGCFWSAREESLPERVKAQICFELHSFEIVQQLLGWKTWSIFFPSFQTQELLVLFLQCYQVVISAERCISAERLSLAQGALRKGK